MADWAATQIKPAEKIGDFVVLTIQAEKDGEEPKEREFRTTNPDGEAALKTEVARWIDRLNRIDTLTAKFQTPGAFDAALPTPVRTEPTKAETDFSDNSARYLRLKAIRDAGLTLPPGLADELTALRSGLEAALATRPNLAKRFPVRFV